MLRTPEQTLAAMAGDDFFIAPGRSSIPLDGVIRRERAETSSAIKSVSEVFCPHEVILSDRENALDFRHASASVSTISFNQISYGADSEVIVRDKGRSQYIVLLPTRGEMVVESKDGRRALGVGSFMVMGPEAAYRFGHDKVDSHLAIGLPRDRIEAGGRGPLSLIQGLDPRALTLEAESFADYAGYLCRELNRGGDLFLNPLMRRSVDDALVALVQAMQIPDAILKRSSGAVPGYVYLAERFMDRNLHEDITVEHIAAAVGTPVRTLSHAFAQFRGMSPMRLLRQKRLEGARRDIVAAASLGSFNILDIANRYGMQHGGRFAAYYQQHFSESPSDTARAARHAPSPSRELL